MRRWIGFVALAMLLGGCGWQLQTVRPMPAVLLPVYLDLSDTQSLFARSLRESLRTGKIQTTLDRASAGSILQVSHDQSGREVTSVSALNQPQQYQIYYRAEYRFDRHDKAGPESAGAAPVTLIPTQLLNVSRTMSYDSTLALAKEREQRAVEELLAKELTQQVLRHLNSVSVAVSSGQ